MKPYDYVLIGAGLFNCVLAERLHKANKHILVVEARDHIGGNCFSKEISGIETHMYGPHVFHTNDTEVWEYLQQFTKFNRFSCRTKAQAASINYSFPINLTTLQQAGVPGSALHLNLKPKPGQSLESYGRQALGSKLYTMFIKGYTEKQWGMSAKKLPASILRRLPVRLTYNDDYFDDRYEGIPEDGYTAMLDKMLRADIQFSGQRVTIDNYKYWADDAAVVCTGKIDEFFNYKYGILPYRSLRFDHEVYEDFSDLQGNAIINYTDKAVPYTRIIEHKHFTGKNLDKAPTVVTFEYPKEWNLNDEAYYPVRNVYDESPRYEQYRKHARTVPNLYFKGRLGDYKYYNMDQTVRNALDFSKILLAKIHGG